MDYDSSVGNRFDISQYILIHWDKGDYISQLLGEFTFYTI